MYSTFFFIHILYFHCSGADAKQQPSTVTLENDHPILCILQAYLNVRVDRDALMQKALIQSVLIL